MTFFTNDTLLVQLISVGAGNGIVLFRSEALCRKVSRRFARYVLEHTYSLQIDVAYTFVSDSFWRDYLSLYPKVDEISGRATLAHPLLPLPVVQTEPSTGLAISAVDPTSGEWVSLETLQKRARAPQYDTDIEHAEGYAYLHIDGNDTGMTLTNLLRGIEDYSQGIRTLRKASLFLQDSCFRALAKTEEKLTERYGDAGRHFRRMNIGGDDVNLLCSAKAAEFAAEVLAEALSEMSLTEGEQVILRPMSVSVGIAKVPEKITYRQGQRLSGICCDKAKKYAKAHRQGDLTPSAIYVANYQKNPSGSWEEAPSDTAEPRFIQE